jgi:RNA processing factor Prp31
MTNFSNNMNNTFLKDLEDLSDLEEEISIKDENEDDIFNEKRTTTDDNVKINESIQSFSNLIKNEKFQAFLKEIKEESFKNNLASSKIYSMITECNKFISQISQEINIISKTIKEIYSERFPELATIILNPYEYAYTVKLLGNDLNVNKHNLSYLPSNVQMTMNIMSSSTAGTPLKNEKLRNLYKSCDDLIVLNENKNTLLNFIENKMNHLCPNLTALLGPSVAAKLVTTTGGIAELAKTTSNNVLVMGSQRINLEGFSTAGKIHMGYLAELEEVQKTPEQFKKQVMRRYANKAVLMARVDAFRIGNKINNEKTVKVAENKEKESKYDSYFNEGINVIETTNRESYNNLDLNEYSITKENENLQNNSLNNISLDISTSKEGIMMKELIGKKMNKIIEPKQPVSKKPLPRPDDKPRRTRGGRRVRSIKQKYALTEIRAMKNRMKFGPEGEVEYRETGKGFGLLGIGGQGGKMKTTAKTQKITTKKQKMLALESQTSDRGINQSSMSGLHSSVVFTPVQGIELINPELIEKRLNTAKEKYFSTTSGFSTVINQKKKNQNSILEI